MGIAPVRREEAVMLPHGLGAGSLRTARGGVSSRTDARAHWHPGGELRKMCRGADWPACVAGQGWACRRITHWRDRKVQREGLGACDGSELYFETKHSCTEKCTMGSRPGPAQRRGRGVSDGGRPPVAGRVRSSGSLRPSASIHYVT